MTPPSTLAPVRAKFRAVVCAVVPSASALDEDAWRRGEATVDEALADRPEGVRKQLVLFVRLVGVIAFLRYLRPLEALSPETLQALLGRLEQWPLLLVRRGVWGLRTLAFMAIYTQEEVQDALGYRAAAAGWDAHGGGQGPWSERGGAGGAEAVPDA